MYRDSALSLAFFSPRNAMPSSRRALDDLLEQLVDRAVARRGDAHPLAGVDEPRDQATRGVRLARARRALDHEVPAVEREKQLGELLHLVRLHVAVERLAAEHRLDRRIAAVAREQRARDPLERCLLRLRAVRAAREQRLRERHLVELGAALELELARVEVVAEQLAGVAERRLVDRVLAELLLLRGIGEREHGRLLLRPRGAGVRQAADRLPVLEQLLGRHVRLVEHRPVDGLALAVVVIEQLGRERGRGIARCEHLLAQRGSLGLLGLLRLRLLRLRQRERPELRERLPTPLEQPVREHARADAVLAVVRLDLRQDRRVALDHPALELDDRGAAVLDRRGAVEVEQVLDLLQPVPLPRDHQPAPDDAVEVDEHLAAQEVVELGLARAVAAHHPPQRRDLVLRVVVDVHVRVLGEPRVDEVDEPLEGRLLLLAARRPQRLERVVAVAEAPEVLEAALGVPERVALEVEEEVAG